MPPRSRTTKASDPEPDEVEPQDAAVHDINTAGAYVDDVDAEERPDRPAYVLRAGGKDWVIERLSAGTVMDLESAPTSLDFLELVFGDQWDDLEPIFRELDGDAIALRARRISNHFGLNPAVLEDVMAAEDERQLSRDQRRARARSRGRRPAPRR